MGAEVERAGGVGRLVGADLVELGGERLRRGLGLALAIDLALVLPLDGAAGQVGRVGRWHDRLRRRALPDASR